MENIFPEWKTYFNLETTLPLRKETFTSIWTSQNQIRVLEEIVLRRQSEWYNKVRCLHSLSKLPNPCPMQRSTMDRNLAQIPPSKLHKIVH